MARRFAEQAAQRIGTRNRPMTEVDITEEDAEFQEFNRSQLPATPAFSAVNNIESNSPWKDPTAEWLPGNPDFPLTEQARRAVDRARRHEPVDEYLTYGYLTD